MRLIDKLNSGGVIVTYACSAACGHCLYKASPKRDKSYMDRAAAGKVFAKIASLGCRSVHIGGGEPFLKPQSLAEVCREAQANRVYIEYIETNASWAVNGEAETARVLGTMLDAGVQTLLISISPFHNEFIPFSRVKTLISACRSSGMSVFPWIAEFASDISRLDEKVAHSLDEYDEYFGEGYVNKLPSRYSVRMGGRATETFRGRLQCYAPDEIARKEPEPCREPFNVNHFHADLHGNYIPGLCAGMSLALEDLGANVDEGSYPLFSLMTTKGISGLLQLSSFPQVIKNSKFLGKCHLCTEIRKQLHLKGSFCNELRPPEFYR